MFYFVNSNGSGKYDKKIIKNIKLINKFDCFGSYRLKRVISDKCP